MNIKVSARRERQISYLLEVVAHNQYQGQHILLSTYHDAKIMNIRPDSIRSVKCNPNPILKGFRITSIPRTNGEIPGQEDIVDHYLRYPALFNMRHHPVIGEVVLGPLRGRRIALFTVEEIRYYFSVDSVRPASIRHAQYAGMKWRAAEFREAEQYYCHPDQSWLLSVFRRSYKYPDKKVTTQQDNQFREQVRQISAGLLEWYHDNDVTGTIDVDKLITLAHWCQKLDKTIQCLDQYARVRDTLFLLQDIIAKGHRTKPQLFMGHCKILERLANEISAVYSVRTG